MVKKDFKQEDKTLLIAQRTRKNLEFIYAQKSEGKDVEEFTQLLNSMLGLVISIRENYFKDRRVEWTEVESLVSYRNCYELKNITGIIRTQESPKLKQISSFGELITNIRHSFAHNCYELLIDDKNIIGVKLWNIPTGKSHSAINRGWEAEIMENELKALAFLVLDYLESLPVADN